MRSMRWARFFGLLLVTLLSTGAQRDQGQWPQVVHAETPQCQLAGRARVSGWTRVRVTVNRDGRVTSGTFEHLQPFTADCVEAAVKEWTFVPSDHEASREALLSFWFTGETQDTEEPSHTISSADDPWTLRLSFAKSSIQRLPRENGEIPEKRCPVHGTVMGVEVIPAGWYARPLVVDTDDPEEQRQMAAAQAYWKAKEKLFPETNRRGTADVKIDFAKVEVQYCQYCRDAEQEWLASHPEFDPN
jgi:hypothetical protein